MMQTPTLLVLAAGMGSRYGGLKQLDPMGPNDETILDYSVHDAIRAGFGRIVFVIRRDLEAPFRDTIGRRYENRIPIDYAFQELDDLPAGFHVPQDRQKPWGTGHAIIAAKNVVTGSFAVINADDFYGAHAYRVLGKYFSLCAKADKQPLCLVAYPLSHTLSDNGTVNRGVCSVDSGTLKTVEEITGIARDSSGQIRGLDALGQSRLLHSETLVSMNFWGFSSAIFPILEAHFMKFLKENGTGLKTEFYIPTFVDTLIASGEFSCDLLETSGQWFGVTYPDDRIHVQKRLRELVAKGEYASFLLD